jgi:transposase
VDTIEDSKPLTPATSQRSPQGQVLAECAKPEASVARIAMAHGLNANLVHKWRRLASTPVPAPAAPHLVHRTAAGRACASRLAAGRERAHRTAPRRATIKVHWPVSAAPACAAWLRELLR